MGIEKSVLREGREVVSGGGDDARMSIKLAASTSGQEKSYSVHLQHTSKSQRTWSHGVRCGVSDHF
jgi:hypothetical protein